MTTITDSQVEAALAAWHDVPVSYLTVLASEVERSKMRAALEAAERAREPRPLREVLAELEGHPEARRYSVTRWNGHSSKCTNLRPPPPEGDGK